MMTLRWTLGLLMALATAGWFAIVIIGGGFRRSFGASDASVLPAIVGVVVPVLVVASLVAPERRALLHVVAVLMVALAIMCLVLMRETVFVGSLGVLYAIAWLTFYYRAVWAPAPG